MGCACIPPPPVFDLPAPPDPSLVWHLLSDEPAERLKEIQQCDSTSQRVSPAEVSTFFAFLHFEYFSYLVIVLGATLSTLLIAMIIILRIRRSKSKDGNHLKKKSECSTDVILAADRHWSYNTMNNENGHAIMIYGPAADDVFANKPMSVTPSSLRSLPRRPNNFVGTPVRNSLRQSATTLRFHGAGDGYCTVGRMYEEIPVRRSDSEAVFEDINAMHERQLMYQRNDSNNRIDALRKPPPNCRPPPPPSQESPLSTDSSLNSFERELEQIHNSPSPKRSIEEDRKSRHSGENGRESGYGTAPSRLWNSPRTQHRQRDLLNRVDSQGRPMPLAVFAQQTDNIHTMTYV